MYAIILLYRLSVFFGVYGFSTTRFLSSDLPPIFSYYLVPPLHCSPNKTSGVPCSYRFNSDGIILLCTCRCYTSDKEKHYNNLVAVVGEKMASEEICC